MALKKLSMEGRFEAGLDNLVKGKVWAFTAVVGKDFPFALGIAVANERGYYPVPEFWCNGDDYNEMTEYADELNEKEGWTEKAATRIIASTMQKPEDYAVVIEDNAPQPQRAEGEPVTGYFDGEPVVMFPLASPAGPKS